MKSGVLTWKCPKKLGYQDSNLEQKNGSSHKVPMPHSPKFRVISRKLLASSYVPSRVHTGYFWHRRRFMALKVVPPLRSTSVPGWPRFGAQSGRCHARYGQADRSGAAFEHRGPRGSSSSASNPTPTSSSGLARPPARVAPSWSTKPCAPNSHTCSPPAMES